MVLKLTGIRLYEWMEKAPIGSVVRMARNPFSDHYIYTKVGSDAWQRKVGGSKFRPQDFSATTHLWRCESAIQIAEEID